MKEGGKTFQQNADVCVCQPNALSCAWTSSASLPLRYPLTHSSLSLLLSVRTRAGPTSSSARPDIHKDPADYRGHKLGTFFFAGTRRVRETEVQRERFVGRGKTAGRIAASHIFSQLVFSPDINVLIKKKNKLCAPWKNVKIHPDTELWTLNCALLSSVSGLGSLHRTVRFFFVFFF